jgi:UDP:flavonoid glycosyltransferase YjiC (YdhE family)
MRAHKPDVLVADLVTTAGMDAAETVGVPLVVNNADLLTAISVRVLPSAPHLPLLFSRKSRAQVGRLDRLLNPLQRWLATLVVDATLGRQWNALRRTRGLRSRRLTRRVANTLVLTNSAFGLEYRRPLPPLLQMVGPMLDEAPPLPEDLRRWLDDGPPVAFANLGTFARPGSALTERLAEGLTSDAFRTLWVLREDLRHLPPSIRTERWVASQVSVLAHPNVRAFVSHCGVNSVHESLSAGTPIVGLPLLADQYDVALRVTDAGVGLLLDKHQFSATQLRAAIHQVAHEDGFRRGIPAIQSSFRLAGGVSRAADLIEHAAAFGVQHWRSAQ